MSLLSPFGLTEGLCKISFARNGLYHPLQPLRHGTGIDKRAHTVQMVLLRGVHKYSYSGRVFSFYQKTGIDKIVGLRRFNRYDRTFHYIGSDIKEMPLQGNRSVKINEEVV